MSTLAAFVMAASETAGHETDKTAYYVIGTGLAVYAVLVAFVGIKGHERWPASEGAKKGVMALSALLVVATMASTILTS